MRIDRMQERTASQAIRIATNITCRITGATKAIRRVVHISAVRVVDSELRMIKRIEGFYTQLQAL